MSEFKKGDVVVIDEYSYAPNTGQSGYIYDKGLGGYDYTVAFLKGRKIVEFVMYYERDLCRPTWYVK